MRNIWFIIFVLIIFFIDISSTVAQGTGINWQYSYGGSLNEFGHKIIKANFDDYILIGQTYSQDGNIAWSIDSSDILWIEVDSLGNINGSATYGGNRYDFGVDAVTSWDNGYIILGGTKSNNYNVSNNHGDMDLWILKINDSGGIQWEKSYGGSDFDMPGSIIKTNDSCYVICSTSYSNNGDVSVNYGSSDIWLLKIDRTGNIIWERTFGGVDVEYGNSVIQTTDNGYLISGATFSNNGMVSGNHGSEDFWIVKTDSASNLQWQKCYGGSFLEECYKAVEMNGSYYLLGVNNSDDGDVTGNHPDNGIHPQPSPDTWLLCIDSVGNLKWNKSLGGDRVESGKDILCYNSNLIIGSESSSNNGDVGNYYAKQDYWVVIVDTIGNIYNQYSFGGSEHDYLSSLLIDSGKLFAFGDSRSNDFDVSGNHGNADCWVVNIELDSIITEINDRWFEKGVSVYPNPADEILYISSTDVFSYKIFDFYYNTITSGTNPNAINLSGIKSGNYVLQLILRDGSILHEKLIVLH